jgi:hypothetical protein
VKAAATLGKAAKLQKKASSDLKKAAKANKKGDKKKAKKVQPKRFPSPRAATDGAIALLRVRAA